MADFKPIGLGAEPSSAGTDTNLNPNNKQKSSATLGDLFLRIGEKIRIKSLIILILILLIVLSDVFVEYILEWFSSSAVDNGQPTTKGTFIQILIIIILFAFADMLIGTGLI